MNLSFSKRLLKIDAFFRISFMWSKAVWQSSFNENLLYTSIKDKNCPRLKNLLYTSIKDKNSLYIGSNFTISPEATFFVPKDILRYITQCLIIKTKMSGGVYTNTGYYLMATRWFTTTFILLLSRLIMSASLLLFWQVTIFVWAIISVANRPFLFC